MSNDTNESKDKFCEALMIEVNIFMDTTYEDEPSSATRSEWFEILMNYFEFHGMGNMRKAKLDYDEVIIED